ncbi:MAG: hypothetical protein JO182_14425 [Acidobacteriaceae bacterium]|nr:hypothetical protein [Acidobacteriaceae bacterium]
MPINFDLSAQLDSFRTRTRTLYLRALTDFPAGMVLPVMICAYAVLVVIAGLPAEAGYYDESITLVQGRMVAEGYTPHADFWSFYPPLTYYLNAAAFCVFGRTILAQRLLQAGFYALFLVLANRFLRRQFATEPLIAHGTTFLLAVAIGPKFISPPFIGFSLSVFALFAFFGAYGARAAQFRRTVAIAGILVGLSLTARSNFGAYAAAVMVLDLVLIRFFLSDGDIPEGVAPVAPWPALVTFLFSAVATWLGAYLILCGPNLRAAVKQSIVFPQQQMMGSRFIPLQFTTLLVLAVMFPCYWFSLRLVEGRDDIPRKAFLPPFFAVLVLFLTWFGGGHPAVARNVAVAEIASILLLHIYVFRLRRAELSLLLFSACLLHYYLSRADDYHWPILFAVPALLVPYFLVPPSGGQSVSAGGRISRGSAIALLASLVALLWCVPGFRPSQIRQGVELILRDRLIQRVSDSERILGSPAPPKPWLSVYPDSDELKALRFVRLRTSAGDPIFIGVDNHAHPFAVDVRAYWLLDRPIGTNYYIFDPDLTRQDAIQNAMIKALTNHRVHWVLIEHDPPMDNSFRQLSVPGSKNLDRFLSANFVEIARFGRYGVLTATSHQF